MLRKYHSHTDSRRDEGGCAIREYQVHIYQV